MQNKRIKLMCIMEKFNVEAAYENLNLIFEVVENEIDGNLIKNYQLDEDLAQEMILMLLEIEKFNITNKELFILKRIEQFMHNYGFVKEVY